MAPDPHRGLQSRSPGGVQQGAEFQVVIRMQMGDEYGADILQRHALIAKATRHAKARIDNDALPAKRQQR